MAEPKDQEFLDDIEQAEADEQAVRAEEIDPEQAELDAVRAERDELKDKRLARDLLPIYDNLKRALDSATDEQREVSAALIEGVELTMRELLNVFSKHGIQVIAPEVGDKFDPQLHEAMFEAPVPGTKAGEIIQVQAEGFMLHDRLLRPAQVGVSSMKES